jgi:NADH:ubiquinone oxidoreductase subunit 3 (subunit A)
VDDNLPTVASEIFHEVLRLMADAYLPILLVGYIYVWKKGALQWD